LQPLFDAAATALADFSKYLETDVIASAQGKFASGHYRFNRLLNEKHFLATDAQKILSYGERLAADTEEALLQQSKKICGDEDISKALAKVRAQHPDASQLLDS